MSDNTVPHSKLDRTTLYVPHFKLGRTKLKDVHCMYHSLRCAMGGKVRLAQAFNPHFQTTHPPTCSHILPEKYDATFIPAFWSECDCKLFLFRVSTFELMSFLFVWPVCEGGLVWREVRWMLPKLQSVPIHSFYCNFCAVYLCALFCVMCVFAHAFNVYRCVCLCL